MLKANPKGGKIETLTAGLRAHHPAVHRSDRQIEAAFRVSDQNMTDTVSTDGRVWRARSRRKGEREGLLHATTTSRRTERQLI